MAAAELAFAPGQPSHQEPFWALAHAAGLNLDRAHLRQLCEAPLGVFDVATSDDQVVGGLLGQRLGDELEIFDIVVSPTWRRQRVATDLLYFSVYGQVHAPRRVLCEVAADNAPAQALYKGLGFAQVGVRPAYYPRAGGAHVDAWLMAWEPA
jgi:ribosomal protein S18 acetylase RimI-like enzyme